MNYEDYKAKFTAWAALTEQRLGELCDEFLPPHEEIAKAARYSLLGGGVMLGALFMATDYATSPALPAAQLVYGVGCGALTVLFRYFGLYPEGVTYAILLMNACAWALDKALPPVRFGAVRGGKAG